MPAESTQVRTFIDDDMGAYRKLFFQGAKERGETWLESPEYFRTIINRPNHCPQHDLFVLSHTKQGLIGFADISSEVKIKRIICDGFVHPDFRRMGLATRLLESVFKRSQEIGAEVIHVCVNEGNRTAHQFLSASGFFPKRHYLELALEMEKVKASPSDRGWEGIGHFHEGQETLLAQVQNKVFSGSWGFCPNTTEDIKYYLRLTQVSIHDVILMEKNHTVIAYLWPQRLGFGKGSSVKKSRVHMFGITPEFRGKGWGRRLLQYALERFKEEGIITVELTVDELNAQAMSLYESLGFQVIAGQVWYEKKLT